MTESIGAFMAAWVTAHEHDHGRARAEMQALAADFRAGTLIDCGPVDLWAWAPKREPECVVAEKAAERQASRLELARRIKQLRLGEEAA